MEWLAGRQLGTAAKGLSEAISPGEIVRSLLGNQDGHGTTFGVHHLTDEDRPGLWLTFDFGSFLDLVPYKARTQDEATKGQNTDQQRKQYLNGSLRWRSVGIGAPMHSRYQGSDKKNKLQSTG